MRGRPAKGARSSPADAGFAILSAIVPLAQADPVAVEALLDAAFGADRRGRTAYRLREGAAPLAHLSFAAFEAGRLVGTLQSWPVQLATGDGAVVPLVLVGPVAVLPARQRGGLGRALMARMLAAWDGTEPLVLIGDPGYYGRFFGFSAAGTGRWSLPGPVERHRLLARGGREVLPGQATLGPRA